MNKISTQISLSRQTTPKRKGSQSPTVAAFASNVKVEKKYSEKLESRVNNLERFSNIGTLRSITPMSSKLLEPMLNIDLNNVCKGSVSILPHCIPEKATTDRKVSSSIRSAPFMITPQIDNKDLSFNQKNIENLRNEISRKREMIVGYKETFNRKELENKYWVLFSELEQTINRIEDIKRKNLEIRNEIASIQTNNY